MCMNVFRMLVDMKELFSKVGLSKNEVIIAVEYCYLYCRTVFVLSFPLAKVGGVVCSA